MKKFLTVILAAVILFVFCAPGWADRRPPMSRDLHRKNLAYNKNYFPPGWQYEAGYAVWRVNRNLPVNQNTYRMYKKDKAWHNRMRTNFRAQQIILNAYDWTVEEIALFMQQNQDLFRFHPAGYEN